MVFIAARPAVFRCASVEIWRVLPQLNPYLRQNVIPKRRGVYIRVNMFSTYTYTRGRPRPQIQVFARPSRNETRHEHPNVCTSTTVVLDALRLSTPTIASTSGAHDTPSWSGNETAQTFDKTNILYLGSEEIRTSWLGLQNSKISLRLRQRQATLDGYNPLRPQCA